MIVGFDILISMKFIVWRAATVLPLLIINNIECLVLLLSPPFDPFISKYGNCRFHQRFKFPFGVLFLVSFLLAIGCITVCRRYLQFVHAALILKRLPIHVCGFHIYFDHCIIFSLKRLLGFHNQTWKCRSLKRLSMFRLLHNRSNLRVNPNIIDDRA